MKAKLIYNYEYLNEQLIGRKINTKQHSRINWVPCGVSAEPIKGA